MWVCWLWMVSKEENRLWEKQQCLVMYARASADIKLWKKTSLPQLCRGGFGWRWYIAVADFHHRSCQKFQLSFNPGSTQFVGSNTQISCPVVEQYKASSSLGTTTLSKAVCVNWLLKSWMLSWRIRGYLLPTLVLRLSLFSSSMLISKNCFLSLKELFW